MGIIMGEARSPPKAPRELDEQLRHAEELDLLRGHVAQRQHQQQSEPHHPEHVAGMPYEMPLPTGSGRWGVKGQSQDGPRATWPLSIRDSKDSWGAASPTEARFERQGVHGHFARGGPRHTGWARCTLWTHPIATVSDEQARAMRVGDQSSGGHDRSIRCPRVECSETPLTLGGHGCGFSGLGDFVERVKAAAPYIGKPCRH
jgi:hypothetical protein